MPKIYVGQRFGSLVVQAQTELRENGYCVWKCICDCGEETMVSTKKLNRGSTSDCGCKTKVNAKNGRIAEDLRGRRFGKLTVLYRVENRNKRTCWKCICDCGQKKDVTSHDLKMGKVKSCGCKKKEGRNSVDLTGKQYGRLTCLYPLKKRDKKGSIYWKCRCDCGNIVGLTESMIVHGNYKSCGCLKKKSQQNIWKQLHRIDGTCIEDLEHRKYRSDNTSGFRGVVKVERKSGLRWRAYIGFKGTRIYLGTYTSFEEAVNARLSAESEIHDEFLKEYYKWKEKADQNPLWAEENPIIFEVRKCKGGYVVIR